jgi:DNA-binding NarL/FixJ family response regulator
VERKNAILLKANIDKERLLALARKDIPSEVSSEIEDIASRYVELPHISLTSREEEIARLCAKGLLSKEIATQLGISPRTVETHKNNLFKKLGINNTVELMRYMQMVFSEKEK